MSMEKLPTEITLCRLECVLMPNGEIIVLGTTVGWFKALSSHLSPTDTAKEKIEAAAPELLDAMEAMFVHCSMVHKHWGESCNQKQADDAIKAGHEAIAKATN